MPVEGRVRRRPAGHPADFVKGDPRAVAAGRRGAVSSIQRRRAEMWDRYRALCDGLGGFECFLEGWRAHRVWSAQRRYQVRHGLSRHWREG